MKEKEFLQELEIALEGRMPEEDVKLVLESYETMFDNGILDGKEEEIITAEFGSPARIVKGILSVRGEEEEDRDTGDAVTDALTQRFLKTDAKIFGMALVPMRTRALAYLLDAALVTIVFTTLTTIPSAIYHLIQMMLGNEPRYMYDSAYYDTFGASGIFGLISPLLIIIFLGAVNLFTAVILWRTKGYTPGKKFFHIRVVKLDGKDLTWKDAFLREVLVKFILNSLTTGFLNGISLVWGFATVDKKTVHDAIAKTVVVSDFTKEELAAMALDRKYARKMRKEKSLQKQVQRMTKKEKEKKEKQPEKGERKPRAERRKEKELEKQAVAVAKARKRLDAKAEHQVTAPKEEPVSRGLNEEELATIERIRANLEEQRKKTEEELFGKVGERRSTHESVSDGKKSEVKGPTIIFKDHEKK